MSGLAPSADAIKLEEKRLTGETPCRIGSWPQSEQAIGPARLLETVRIRLPDFCNFLFGVVVQPALIGLHARRRAESHVPVATHHDAERPPAVIAAHAHELRDQAPSAGG